MSNGFAGMRALTVGFISFLFTLVGGAQEPGGVISKGPYLQGPGTDTMTIKWESFTNIPGVLHYGLKGTADTEFKLETPRRLNAVSSTSVTNVTLEGVTNVSRFYTTNIAFLYEAPLKHLQPGSAYTYWVEMDQAHSRPRQFKTFAANPAKVTFIGYGDARSNPRTHLAVVSNFKRYQPDFILHTGDLVVDGRRYDVWGREFFGPLAEVIDEIPILPSIGNHEQDGTNYMFYMALPGKERWYSYDFGPVHVVALDFRLEKGNDAQFAFAREDLLASKAPWKVVFMHYPMFNIGGHASGWGHAAYLPLFHEAKVDLVVGGHSHLYERFQPIAGTNSSDSWPITHITTGGGGAPLYPAAPHPALASFYSTNHFVVFEATASNLTARAFTTNNTLLDEIELTKTNGQPATAYLAQVYPENAMKLFYELGTNLIASLSGIPSQDNGVQARFTIPPVKEFAAPLPIKLTLTPDSEKYYELEDGPVLTSAPGSNQPENIVWTRVRSKGIRSITSDPKAGGAMVPPLIFQARIKVGKVDALAYGQKSRLMESASKPAAEK